MPDSDHQQKVSLGCGTLILIAIIVLIFSGGGKTNQLQREITDLRNEVRNLGSEVRSLRTTLEQQQRVHATTPAPR